MSSNKPLTKVGALFVGMAKTPGVFRSFSRLGFEERAKHFDDSAIDLRGKVVVITGANSGIGFAAAKAMIARGGQLWLLCRNPDRGQAALEQLRSFAQEGGSAELIVVDMSDLGAIRSAVPQITSAKIDVLVHNAGSLNDERQLTREGLELDFALHLAGPHLLTTLLMPRLIERHGRVIFVASGGMYSERLSVAETQWSERKYDGVRAYAQVKRGQVVLAQEWAAHQPGVAFYAMHPGWVDTPGVETSLPRFYRWLRRWLRSPSQGADTIVWLAGCKELSLEAGAFCLDRQAVTRYLLPGTREAPAEAEKLWSTLQELL